MEAGETPGEVSDAVDRQTLLPMEANGFLVKVDNLCSVAITPILWFSGLNTFGPKILFGIPLELCSLARASSLRCSPQPHPRRSASPSPWRIRGVVSIPWRRYQRPWKFPGSLLKSAFSTAPSVIRLQI